MSLGVISAVWRMPAGCRLMLQSATMKFRYPQLHSKLPYEKLERELEGVIRLLLNGLDDGGAGRDQPRKPAEVQKSATLASI